MHGATNVSKLRRPGPRTGFTLVELAVAVVILGVLAAFGMSRWAATAERSKAAEAFEYLKTVHSAQERYLALSGTYAPDLDQLDVGLEAPTYFSVSAIELPPEGRTLETDWQMTLTREGPSGGYGAYTVIYTREGFDGRTSTIDPEISPLQGATGGGGAAPSTGGDEGGGGIACSPGG